jgi:hypothetical protein
MTRMKMTVAHPLLPVAAPGSDPCDCVNGIRIAITTITARAI